MGRQNIYSTLSVGSVMPPSMLNDLVDFLVTHRQNILPPSQKAELFRTRFSGHTLVSEIVSRLVTQQKDQAFSLMRIPSKTTVLREVVDMTFVPFDLLQIKEVTPSFSKTLSLISELNDKMVLNITDITKANGDFSDVTVFHWRLVRDFLSRSFYTSPGNIWISPVLVRYVAKVYSMTIGGRIASIFGLSPLMQSFIQSVFCLYFVAKMTTKETAPAFMKSHYRDLGIYDLGSLEQVLAFVADDETLGKPSPETLEDVFKVIDTYGHDQLKGEGGISRLNRATLNVRFGTLFSEKHVSAIALEYPPYFLFLIILSLSNVRSGLSISMKSLNLVREGQNVMEQALKSPGFISSI